MQNVLEMEYIITVRPVMSVFDLRNNPTADEKHETTMLEMLRSLTIDDR